MISRGDSQTGDLLSTSNHVVDSRVRKRSRRGCMTCRSRKVKCDELAGACMNCQRLKLTCIWNHDIGVASQRSRSNKACERCRTKRIKCWSIDANAPCDRCQKARVSCIRADNFALTTRPSSSTATSATSSPNNSESALQPIALSIPDRWETIHLLDSYFSGPHYHCFYTFIHQPTFMQMLDNDLIPKSLLLIIIATSLHFTDPASPLPNTWTSECRGLIMQEVFAPPSTLTLQTLLLLQRYEWHSGAHMSAWLISALATRLAHALQLNLELPDRPGSVKSSVSTTVKETRRRLIWSCFVMESYIEAGRNPLSTLDVSAIEAKLPCDDHSYLLGMETDMPTLDQAMNGAEESIAHKESRPGISTILIRIACLRKSILQYTFRYHPRNQGHIPESNPWNTDSPFYRYEKGLDDCRIAIPEELKFNFDVLYRQRSQLVSFVTLHCMLHACYCDLFRIGGSITALNQSEQIISAAPVDFLDRCRRDRLQHAFAIANVISHSKPHQTAEHDPVTAICACLAIRVLVIERRKDDSAILGLTDDMVSNSLDALVDCATRTAKRSEPIRRLVLAHFKLASQNGFPIDVSNITEYPPTPAPGNPPSPSLRTYGTFGSIQNSLEKRNDAFTPVASSDTEKQSDLYIGSSSATNPASISTMANYTTSSSIIPPQSGLLSYEALSPQAFQLASGWANGTLDYSAAQAQFNWAAQSLEMDPDFDWAFNPLDMDIWNPR